MDMNPIVQAMLTELVKQITPAVIEAVKAEVNIAAQAHLALEPDTVKELVRDMLVRDTTARDTVRDIVDDVLGNYDITDNREFAALASKVDELETKVDEIEEHDTPVDADNDDFKDAVCSVIRNNI